MTIEARLTFATQLILEAGITRQRARRAVRSFMTRG
jgi:hypothetical protein